MAVQTAAGTKVYIASGVTNSDADTVTEFEGLTWVEIKGVTNTPEYGDEDQIVNAADLGDARNRKGKGIADAGNATLTVNAKPNDPGQQALVAAKKTKFTYPFRVVWPDKLNATGTDTEEFFHALVTSNRRPGGDVNSLMQRTFMLAIDSEVYEKTATAGA